MANWLWFLLGIISAFVISFGAIVGWWFLYISRENKNWRTEVRDDFDRIRRGIAEHQYERRN